MDMYPAWIFGRIALFAFLVAAIAITAWFAADVLTTDLRLRVRYWLGITAFCCGISAAILAGVWLIS